MRSFTSLFCVIILLGDIMDNNYINVDLKKLIEWTDNAGCICSDMITKDGYKVGYMYREEPSCDVPDSGWRFLAGIENPEYMNDSKNHHVFHLNTICNYDSDIIPFLDAPVGSSFIRIDSNTFVEDDRTLEIFSCKQDR